MTLAKSQEFNDNTGNADTDFCFHCLKYKTKDEFDYEKEGQICVECRNELDKLSKEKGIEFKEVVNSRESRTMSGDLYYLNDVFAVKDGKEFFIRGYRPNKIDFNFPNSEKADIFNMKMQFVKSDGRFVKFYCHSENPIEFIKFIKENKYHFEKRQKGYYDCEFHISENKERYEFHGNLKEISCAFHFRIFRKDYVKEIAKELEGMKGIKIKLEAQ